MNNDNQYLRFKWNDHTQHLSKFLLNQRLEEQFCDATVISGDGYVIKAHQAVLASTSGYFKHVLASVNSDQHPMIVLHEANFKELCSILDYMYLGITQVEQQLMESVLEVADMLEIKGLSRIRNNAAIRKFMSPCCSPAPTSSNMSPRPSSALASLSLITSSLSPTPSRKDCSEEIWEKDLCQKNYDREGMQRKRLTENRYSDQNRDNEVSGMDLSVSKNVCETLSSNKSPELKKGEKRKSCDCQEESDEHYVNPLLDPDWGRLGNDKVDIGLAKPLSADSEETSQDTGGVCLSKMKKMQTNGNEHAFFLSSGTNSSIVKMVEVVCPDGPLTISLTTGNNSSFKPFALTKKNLLSHSSNHLLQPIRQQSKVKKTLSHSIQKCFSKEKKLVVENLSSDLRPLTRSLDKLKKDSDDKVLSVNVASSVTSKDSVGKQVDQNSDSENDDPADNSRKLLEGKEDDKNASSKFPSINPLSLFTLPPVKEKEKQTRTTLTVDEKIKVIEAFLDGKSQRQIASMYGIGKTQVSCIIKKKEEILTLYRNSILRGETLTMKRQRKSEYASLNEHLIQWYRHMSLVAGVKITTGMLRAKALQIAPELGYHDFKASNGWLATFKANNNLKFSKTKKNDNADLQNCQNELDHQDEDDAFYEDGNQDDGDDLSGKNMGSVTHGISENNDSAPIPHMHLSREAIGGGGSSNLPSLPNSNLLPINLPKPSQVSNSSISSNLTATAYNLSRDLSRDINRSGDASHLGDVHSAGLSSSAVNHPVSALSVTRSAIDSTLNKPSDSTLSYKSEDSLVAYGYDSQSRMNDPGARGAEYNYPAYGFPSSYYSYHFLGQY